MSQCGVYAHIEVVMRHFICQQEMETATWGPVVRFSQVGGVEKSKNGNSKMEAMETARWVRWNQQSGGWSGTGKMGRMETASWVHNCPYLSQMGAQM